MRPRMTQDELKNIVSYDPVTGVFNSIKKRKQVSIGVIIGKLNKSTGYLQCSINGVCYTLHRLAWLYVYGKFPENNIDHINGVKTDNRLSNIREVSISENQHNKWKPKSNNKTGMLGVHKSKGGRYIASITVGAKVCYLGVFETACEAHKAYMDAKIKLHPSAFI